jgi:anaerobic selenocysteine-containing dehydrogenase
MTTVHESVCTLDCPDTCSLSVTVEGGRIQKVDGSRRNPFTAGYICAKVRRFPERVYSPLRVLHPQRRVGSKGAGTFARITWEEAIATIAERFRHISATDGPEAILPYHYGGSNGLFSDGALDSRFFNRLGASELLKTICAAPTGTVYRAMYGTMGSVPPEDYRFARAIILWGANPAVTGIHLLPHVRAAQRAGAALVVIDPRCTAVARGATMHLQPQPGTDVVLALGLIHELVRTGRVDAEFVRRHVHGFETLTAAAAAYPLSRAAEICGLAEADLSRLAAIYADASPAVIRCGWGVERNRNGGNAARAILALPAVAGKFGVRGGGMTMSLGRTFPIDKDALARPDLRTRPARGVNMSQLGRALTEPQAPPLRALFVYNANPVAMAPDQGRVCRGLAREDLFTVVHEQVLTDTARFADILLPATTAFEQAELKRSYGTYYLQYATPVIPPLGEAVSNAELFARLARAMGFDDPALSPTEDALMEAALAASRERLGGVGAERLRTEKIAALRFAGQRDLVQFKTDFPTTPSRKIELCPPELGPVRYAPRTTSPYPLALLSPASDRTINSTFGELDGPQARLALHADDAVSRGIRDGDAVRVFNDLGEVHVRATVGRDVRPGVVSLPKGLWQRSTLNGATATTLVADDLSDLGEGACFNDARVEVEPLA